MQELCCTGWQLIWMKGYWLPLGVWMPDTAASLLHNVHAVWADSCRFPVADAHHLANVALN